MFLTFCHGKWPIKPPFGEHVLIFCQASNSRKSRYYLIPESLRLYMIGKHTQIPMDPGFPFSVPEFLDLIPWTKKIVWHPQSCITSTSRVPGSGFWIGTVFFKRFPYQHAAVPKNKKQRRCQDCTTNSFPKHRVWLSSMGLMVPVTVLFLQQSWK